MGLTISSYLADKYLINCDEIEDSEDFFYNKPTDETKQSNTGASSATSEESKYIIMFNGKLKGYVDNSEQAKTVIADIKQKVFSQIGFSPEYMSYWRENINKEENIEKLDNGEVLFDASFVQKNRNFVISYERILYNFKIVKAKSLIKKLY